jgi:hypothetical protein
MQGGAVPKRRWCCGLPLLILLLLLGPGAGPAAASTSRDLTLLEQGYATSLPVDVYDDQGTDLHVAETGGTTAYKSYLLIATDSLQAGDVVQDLRLTLRPDPDSNGNQNAAAALLQACPLSRPLPQPFDPASPPPDACPDVHVPGQVADDGSWTFDLLPLLRYWLGHGGNTGLVVLPAGAGPGDAWSVAFAQARTQAVASIDAAAPAPATAEVDAPPPAAPIDPPAAHAVAPPPPL